MPQIRASELRAGLASGKITEADIATMRSQGVGVVNDEPSVASQAAINQKRIASGQDLPPAGPDNRSLIEKGGQRIYDALAGEGKSFINSAYNTAKGVANVAQNQPADTVRNPDFEYALKPQNTEDSTGQTLGNMAQFILAGQASGPAANAMRISANPQGIGAGFAALANAGTRGLAQAIPAGATAQAQGSDPTLPALAGGAVGALEPAIEAGAGALSRGIINRNVLRSKPSQFIRGADPGRAVADNGIMALTEKSLAEKIAASKQASGQIVGQQTARVPGSFNPTPELNSAVDQQVQKAIVDGGDTGRLEAFRQGRTGEIAARGANGPIDPQNAQLPASDIAALKRSAYDSIDWSPNADSALNTARQDYAGGLNDMVRVPENANYADLAEAQKALSRKMNTGQGLTDRLNKLGRGLTAGGVGGAYGYHKNGVVGGLTDAAAMYLLQSILGSTGAQTLGAQGLRGVGSMAGAGLLAPMAAQAAAGRTDRDEYLRKLMARNNGTQ